MTSPADLRLAWARAAVALGRHRRVVAALLAGVAVLAALNAVAPPGPETARVLVAAHDLRGDAPLEPADLRAAEVPVTDVPAGALRSPTAALGHLTAGPVRRGEILTDVRLVGSALISRSATGSGMVATPVRLADAGLAAVVHAGDVVDVVASPAAGAAQGGTPGESPRVIARAVRVLAVPAPDGAVVTDGVLILVEADEQNATALAAAAGSRLSVLLRDRS